MWRRRCCTLWGIPPTCTEVKIKRVDSSFLTLALAPVADKWAAGSLRGPAVCSHSIQPGCSANTRGGARLHPLPRQHLCRVREPSCPSPSQSLCSGGQWGVSAASPVTWGETLATADVVTAPGPLQAGAPDGAAHLRRTAVSQKEAPVPSTNRGTIMDHSLHQGEIKSW